MRQFIATEPLNEKEQLLLFGKEKRYLKNVLRLKSGESIQVRLLDGQLLEMELVKQKDTWLLQKANGAKRKETGVQAKKTDNQNLEIHLLQALIKPSKMEQLIRQASECGVKRIVPIRADLSQLYLADSKKERWETIIKEARQQSGSPVSTELTNCMSFDEFFTKEGKNFALFTENNENNKKKLAFKCYLSENIETESLFSLLTKNGKPEIAYIVIGCEGDLSKREVDILEHNGFVPFHLSTNILRAETAALYGLAILQNAVMEFNSWQKPE